MKGAGPFRVARGVLAGDAKSRQRCSCGVAVSASCSVNERLSLTACSVSGTLRPRCVARVRA